MSSPASTTWTSARGRYRRSSCARFPLSVISPSVWRKAFALASSFRYASQNASVEIFTSLKMATSASGEAFLPEDFGSAAPGSAASPVNERWLAPSMKTAFSYGLLILVLILRPRGFFGAKET